MKCPNCGQELIDNKDFCTNCGKRLKEEKRDIKPRTAIIIMAILIVFGIGVCLSIMYLGTDKELAPFLKDKDKTKEENNNNNDNNAGEEEKPNEEEVSDINSEKVNISDIEKYFGNYIITKVTTTKNTSEDVIDVKERLIGWVVEFSDTQVKFGIPPIEWIIIDKPSFYVDNKDNVKSLFQNNSSTLNILSNGKNTVIDKTENINFVINNNKLYVYRYNALFELSKVETNYKENKSFYNITLLSDNYTNLVNDKINQINDEIKNDIENSSGAIIWVISKAQNEGDLTHIYIKENIGLPYSSSVTKLNVYTYNNSTSEFLNLEKYLAYKGKTLNGIKSVYDTEGAKLAVSYGEDLNKLPLTKDSVYYVDDNTLYIQYANTPDGYVYVEIKL